MDLPSEAGQTPKQIAKIAPIAMIFVPSADGISHSPKEFTSWQDVANGAEVLYRVVLLLDERLKSRLILRAEVLDISTASSPASVFDL